MKAYYLLAVQHPARLAGDPGAVRTDLTEADMNYLASGGYVRILEDDEEPPAPVVKPVVKKTFFVKPQPEVAETVSNDTAGGTNQEGE